MTGNTGQLLFATEILITPMKGNPAGWVRTGEVHNYLEAVKGRSMGS